MTKNFSENQEIIEFEFRVESEQNPHFHQNVELLYILEGEADLQVGDRMYSLLEEDLVVINAGKKHSYLKKGDSLIVRFEIDYVQLCKILATRQVLFWCNSAIDKNSAFEKLRDCMKEIFAQYHEQNTRSILLMRSYYYKLIQLLVENFRISSGNLEEPIKREERRNKIAEYIDANYQRRVTLGEMADELFVSPTYLSKYIKREFGKNFLQYIGDVRLYHALDELIYTDKNIINIALDNGFASNNSFNEIFKKRYAITPSEYRQNKRKLSENKNKILKKSQNNSRIQKYLEGIHEYKGEAIPQKNIVQYVDTTKMTDYKKSWNRMINAGRVGDLLRSDVREHVLMLKRELGFFSVRIWDLFDPSLMINESDSHGNYNFEKIDKVLDFLVENKIAPYIEMGHKPKKVHRTLEDMIITETREIRFVHPNLMNKFYKDFVNHLVNRYGVDEMEGWSFEQWRAETFGGFEKNIKEEQYFFEIFDILWESVKAVSDKIKVGGGGIGIQYGSDNLKKLVESWEKQKHYPDFISLYCYPYIRGNEDGTAYAKISTDSAFLKNQLQIAREVIQNSRLNRSEIHVSEWSFTISNRNILNDSCYKGAYVMKNIIDSLDMADVLGYWTGTDIFAEYHDNSAILFGGCGLVSKDGIKKPAFYAYDFLNYMHKYLLKKEPNYLITTDSRNNFFVSAHNYKHLNYKYYLKAEDKQEILRLRSLYENTMPMIIKIKLCNVKNGKYKIKTYSVSDRHGSIQEEWKNMGQTSDLTKSEVEYVKRISVPHIQIKEESVIDSTLEFVMELLPQEIQYIHITYLYG